MTEEPEIVYVARDADGSLKIWSEEPLFIERSWKAPYWDTDECEPGTMDPDRFIDTLDDGEIGMFELRRLR